MNAKDTKSEVFIYLEISKFNFWYKSYYLF